MQSLCPEKIKKAQGGPKKKIKKDQDGLKKLNFYMHVALFIA